MAYGLSAFYDGVAGGLMAVLLSYITPGQFWSCGETLKVLTMITVGGMGGVAGSVIGAVVLSIAGEALRFSSLFLEIGDGLPSLVVFIVLMPGRDLRRRLEPGHTVAHGAPRNSAVSAQAVRRSDRARGRRARRPGRRKSTR